MAGLTPNPSVAPQYGGREYRGGAESKPEAAATCLTKCRYR